MLSADETLIHLNNLNRERQRRFYEKNKVRVCEKKKQDRADLKNFRKNCNNDNTQNQRIIPQTDNTPEPVSEVASPEPVSEVASINNITPVQSPTVYSQEYVLNFLNNMEIPDTTKKTYVNGVKTIFYITKCPDLPDCLKHPDKIIKQIENGNKQRGTGKYSLNSKKSFYQTIVYLIDTLKIPVSADAKKKYNNIFDTYKIKSTDETKARLNDEEYAVMIYKDYMKTVLDKFGKNSKEYLLAAMYNEAPLRDDFVMTLVESESDISANDKNYLIVPEVGNIIFYIQKYKTEKKYGSFEIKTSKVLNKLLRDFIERKDLSYGDLLFPENIQGLSGFIGIMNKKIGILHGGIDYIRQSKISDAMRNSKPEDRVELAGLMKHSPMAQEKYVRMLKE